MARRAESKAIARRGLMLVLSSPSGAGKTTLSRMLLTPRARHRAVDLGDDAAEAAAARSTAGTITSSTASSSISMVRAGELLEYAEVFGNCYGTPRKPVEKALKAGPRRAVRHRLAGHAAIARDARRDDLVSVFVLPPSSGELARRLHTRAQDDKKVIRARMAKAGDEMSHWAEYDYVVVNRDLDRAFGDVRAILARRAAEARATDRPVRVRARLAVETLNRGRLRRPSAQVWLGGAKKHLREPPHWQRQ